MKTKKEKTEISAEKLFKAFKKQKMKIEDIPISILMRICSYYSLDKQKKIEKNIRFRQLKKNVSSSNLFSLEQKSRYERKDYIKPIRKSIDKEYDI